MTAVGMPMVVPLVDLLPYLNGCGIRRVKTF